MGTNPANERDAFRAADRKYRTGDSLTDAELKLLYKGYNALEQTLRVIGHESYDLVYVDAIRRTEALRGFIKARQERDEKRWRVPTLGAVYIYERVDLSDEGFVCDAQFQLQRILPHVRQVSGDCFVLNTTLSMERVMRLANGEWNKI